MPMPLWWGQINKKLFNPRALENGRWQILNHVGRSSGKPYRTPLAAYEIDGSYLFVLVYGSRSDWVQNLLASGSATLQDGDVLYALGSPRIIPAEEGRRLLDGSAKLPPAFLKIDEVLQMDIVSREPAGTSRS